MLYKKQKAISSIDGEFGQMEEIWKRCAAYMSGRYPKLPLKVPIYFIGMAITCLGTAFFTLNALGSDAMNTLFTAIAVKLDILPGGVYTVFNTSMLLAGFLFAKRYMGIGSFLMILCQGFFINSWMLFLGRMPWLFEGVAWKTVSAGLGYVCRTLGGALSTSMCLGTAGFEACLFTLADKIKIEYKYLKMFSEVIYFIVALFLNGVYGIMTVVDVLFYGFGISFFMVRLNRGPWKSLGISDERNDLSRNRRRRAS